jgi:serpin B
MIVLLPDSVLGLPGLEARLDPAHLARWIAALRLTEVDLHLPRFDLESRVSLGSVLTAMGMPSAFSDRADFSRMDGARDLWISVASHQARGEFDENGMEAAAATLVTLGTWGGLRPTLPAPPVEFVCDHPFLFLIRDNATGTLLFMGRVANPRQ